MSRDTVRYSVLAVYAGPSPATGFQWLTGFNNVYTGANSGQNQISSLERVQTVSDSFTLERTNVNQLGQLAYVSQELINQPNIPVQISWIQASAANESKIGLYVSGDQGAIRNILNRTQDNRNLFIAVAPEGQDAIDYTGQMQVFQLNNSFFESYSSEASVGGFATANATFQAVNYSTSTGSINQTLNAIDLNNGSIVPGLLYTLPTATTGIVGAVPALRYSDITATISGVQGLVTSDLKLQSYRLDFNTNLQNLLKLGSRFAYTKIPTFPVNLNCTLSANYGDLATGSLSNLFCADNPFNIHINLYQPGCGGYGPVVLKYDLLGVKMVSQDFGAQDVGSNTATVNMTFLGQIGGSDDTRTNLRISGFNG